MAALDMSLVARSEAAVHQLIKRKNWAQREPGVIVVFAIVGAVAILLIALFIQKKVRSPYPIGVVPGTCSYICFSTDQRSQGQCRLRYPPPPLELIS